MGFKLTPEEEKQYSMIRDLIFIHEHINAIENVYYRSHGMAYLAPNYVLEKLETVQEILNVQKEYWSNKGRDILK